MVNNSQRLDQTFAALVDPTRRAILARLEREGGISVSELAVPFAIKLPAVMTLATRGWKSGFAPLPKARSSRSSVSVRR